MSFATWCLLQADRLKREQAARFWIYRRLRMLAEREDHKAALFAEVLEQSPWYSEEEA